MNELIRTFNDSKLPPIIVVKIQQTLQGQFQHLEHLYFIFHQEIPLTQRIPIPTFYFASWSRPLWQIIPNFVSRINFLLAPSYSYPTITYIIFQHELFFPLLFNYYTPECKFLLDLNYSCPTDTSTTIIVPTICLLLQLSFTVFKRSSLSRTKVPHQVIRDLLSSESFSSESAFRNSESLIPTTGYIYFFPSRMPTCTFPLWIIIIFFFSSLFELLHIANGSICNVSGILCLGQIQINLDQTAHCHGSNFNVSSSPNQHSYQSDQFLSTWSNWSIPHHLDKHKMKRSMPYESCFLDKTSPLDPRNVPSHNFQQTAASDTSGLRSSLPPPRMEQNHRRTLYWLAVSDSNICDEYFEITFCFCSLCRINCIISTYCYFQLLIYRHP